MTTAPAPAPVTLVDKIWSDHVVARLGDGTDLVAIDRVVLHERGGGVALRSLTDAGRTVRNPSTVFATIDHVVDTFPGRTHDTLIPGGREFIRVLRDGAETHGVRLFDIDRPEQGIVHVMSVEQGIALPGCTVTCNDSHTGTVGGIGALGMGIGSTESEHVLATGTLALAKPRPMRVVVDGPLAPGVSAKDVVLALIGRIGADGGNGCAVELAGSAVEAMGIEGRLTLCNMAVELAARTAVVAPDDATFEYLAGAQFAPQGPAWDQAVAYWRTLRSDDGATFAREVSVDGRALTPQVTWGVSPEHVTGVDGVVPDLPTPEARNAYDYMQVRPGEPLEGIPVDVAFVGSCTNGRLSDLEAAADVLAGRRVAPGVTAICVPGSAETKRRAEARGLDRVFTAAGFEWREPGCSLCFFGGGEGFGGRRVVTTTNRNFENRQGRGARSHLASPATVAASAVAGRIADPRKVAVS